MTPLSSRFTCSIAACPVDTSMNRSLLQFGQSSQPSPLPVSRTIAPATVSRHTPATVTIAIWRNRRSDSVNRGRVGVSSPYRPQDTTSVARVLSSFDDFPIHQTSHPIAQTGSTDINHYDRYFFNGYTKDTRLFFALAMGLYPNRHVADASFSVVVDGGTVDARQISVHASRRAPADRADANEVGPIRVEVLEPLNALRVVVEAPEHGLRADLTFVRRSAPIEEAHFHQQIGLRVVFDYTRLTQFGGWEGWIEVDGELTDLAPGETLGCRDRSWGVRPVGERGSTGAPVADPQFFWLWAPINFDTFSTHFDVNEYFDGRRWHESGFVAPIAGAGTSPDDARRPKRCARSTTRSTGDRALALRRRSNW